MAITSIGAHFLPSFFDSDPDSTIPGLMTAGTLNASGDRLAFVVVCPKTGTLDKFEFKTGAVSNNPDNGIRLSFQTVDMTTGMPDTTQDQYRDITGTISADTWQVPGLMTSDGTDVGVKRSVTAGEQIACVVDFVSFVALDSLIVQALSTNSNNTWGSLTYIADASTGTYTKKTSERPNLALKYDDGTYAAFPLNLGPVTAFTNTAFNSGSTPDEIGNVFQVPISCRVIGAWYRGDANGDHSVVLYDGTPTAQLTAAIDPDATRSTSGLNVVYFSSSYTLSASTTYRIVVKPTTVTNTSLINETLPGSGYGSAFPQGTTWQYTSRTDAGSFTDDNTKRAWIGLIVDGYETGAGGGGGGGGSFTFVG